MTSAKAQAAADLLHATNPDLWIEIVHCENLDEPAAQTAKSFDVPLATVRAIYAEQRTQRKQPVTPNVPPHMNPMTPDEVTHLLKATMHGPLPRDTQQRLFATLASWAPIVQARWVEVEALGGVPAKRNLQVASRRPYEAPAIVETTKLKWGIWLTVIGADSKWMLNGATKTPLMWATKMDAESAASQLRRPGAMLEVKEFDPVCPCTLCNLTLSEHTP